MYQTNLMVGVVIVVGLVVIGYYVYKIIKAKK